MRIQIQTQVVVICGPMPYQLDHGGPLTTSKRNDWTKIKFQPKISLLKVKST